jgi:hypothetical protein
MLLDLLEQAARIRGSLAAFVAQAAADRAGDVSQIRRLMAGAADALNGIAGAPGIARAEREWRRSSSDRDSMTFGRGSPQQRGSLLRRLSALRGISRVTEAIK